MISLICPPLSLHPFSPDHHLPPSAAMPVSTTTYFQSSPGRPSYSTTPPSPDRKKSTKREDKWILQYGSKLHSLGRDKAPYPLSYNREVLEM